MARPPRLGRAAPGPDTIALYGSDVRRCRLLIAVPVVLALSACAPTLTPIPGWSRALCVDKAVAVQSPWDDTVRRVFVRLADVARADLGGRDVAVVVVTGPPTVDGYTQAGGWACPSPSGMMTIALHAWTVESAFTGADAESVLARVIAHELAHVVMHFDGRRQVDPKQREYEADYLGGYYFAKAGFTCQSWLNDLARMMSQTSVRPGQTVLVSPGRLREIIGLRRQAVERGCRQAVTGQHPLGEAR